MVSYNFVILSGMDELLAAVQPYVDRFGGVGMAVIALLDCSFVSMPSVSDLLIVWQTIKTPELWWYYALMTTAGSVAGSMVVYFLGRKGGEAFLLKRFKAEHVARARRVVERYGFWALMAVAFAPPPAPYKIFVLLAGIGGVGPATFALAVALGRGLRFLGEGWFAVMYGQEAARLIRDHLTEASLGLLAVTAMASAVWMLWRRRRPA